MPHKDPEARRAYNAAYHAAHRAESIRRHTERYASNPEEAREKERLRSATRRATDPEYRAYHAAYHAAWYARNREHVLARTSAYAATHPAQRRAIDAAYSARHPAKICAKSASRRARKAGATLNDFTAAQWIELQAIFDHRCAYCGRRAKGHLTQDHITPLSKGGAHTLANIVPACGSCNSKKRDKAPSSPVQPLLLTVAQSHAGRPTASDAEH